MEITLEKVYEIAQAIPGSVEVYLVKDGFKRIYYSKEIPTVCGYTDEEYKQLQNSDALALSIEPDRTNIAKKVRLGLARNTDVDFTCRLCLKSKQHIWVRAKARVIGTMNNAPVLLAMFFNLSKETEPFKQILDTSARIVYVCDRSTHEILYVNQRFCDYTGISQWDAVGKHCSAVLSHTHSFIEQWLRDSSTQHRTLSGQDEETGVYYEIEGKPLTWCGYEAYVFYYADVTEQTKNKLELDEKNEQLIEDQRTLNSAVNNAGMLYYDYYPETHTAVRPQGNYLDTELNVLSDFPNCVLPLWFPEEIYANIYKEAFERIDAGSAWEQFEMHVQHAGRFFWFRCNLESIYRSDGTRSKVACTSFDITAQKDALQAYERHMDAVMTMNPTAISTFRLNLTEDICENSSSQYANLQTLAATGTISGLVRDALAMIPFEEHRKRFAELFVPENLIRLFQEGHTRVSLDHSYYVQNQVVSLVTSIVDMTRNPLTGNIEGIAFTLDRTKTYFESKIQKLLLDTHYDCVALINVQKSTCILQNASFNDEVFPLHKEVPYDSVIRNALVQYVLPQDHTIIHANTDLAFLQKQLENTNTYSFTVNGRSSIKNENSCLQKYSYHYLDDSKSIILATVEDVTTMLDHDVLTGDFNRRGFINHVRNILNASRDQEQFAILYFNIKGFKVINELFGVEGGDDVIRKCTELLRASPLHPIAQARFEADHFVALIYWENLNYAELTHLCDMFYEKNGKQFKFYARCGIYRITDKTRNISHMCDRAKLAKEYIVDDYVRPYAVFNDTMKQTFVAKRELTSELSRALSNKQFEVYYQPIFDAKTEKIVSAEALIRWNHPSLGVVSPGMFVPALEENGYISELDSYVAHTVKTFLENRAARQLVSVPIAINFSRMDFYDQHMMQSIISALQQTALPGQMLRIEVTESAYSALLEQKNDYLSIMKAEGASILVDDFGSGYSSFSTIQDFDFDIIKLDMGFVQKIGKNRKSEWIIHSIIDMAHHIGIKVIAEGAETKAHVDYLKQEHCDYIQGYYYSKPLPMEQFVQRLEECAMPLKQ